MPEPSRPSRWQLLLECAQRELTYLPVTASFLLAWCLPEWGPTWMIAPALFTVGGAHFIYDFLMGKEVRQSLSSRMERKEEQLRDSEIGALKEQLSDSDQKAIVAVRALEKALMDKIKENQRALELTGTFTHTYVDMVRSVADSAIAALRRKRALLETSAKLSELRADEDAHQLCGQLPALDDRIDQARGTLQEALTQLTLLETEEDTSQLSSLSGALRERLKLADELARAARPQVSTPELPGIDVDPLPEEPAESDRDRERKKTR